MQTESDHRGMLSTGLAALALALAAALGGCVGGGERLIDRPERPKAERTLTAGDFHDSTAVGVHGSGSPNGSTDQAATDVTPPGDGTTDGPQLSETPAPSEQLDETIPAVVSHAGLVGQVNGRPIFVADFFAPIENELRILGREKSRKDFIREAFPIIQRQLAELIKNELVYAEAESSLTENERVGLLYFLQQLEGDVTRQRGRVAQDSRMREETGLGLDEVIELERRRQLVMFKIQTEIRKRVIISWRDIERYYRDHQGEFNPPASIQLRLLAVQAENAAARKAIEQSLAEGYLFGTLAEEHSTVLASRGGLMEPVLLGNGLEGTALTAWPDVDAVARTLEKGETGGPVIVGDRAIWVHVEDRADGSGRSLYDAQHDIEKRLYQERYQEQEQKYLGELFARGNMDDFDNMAILLLDIAMQRWAAAE